LRWWKKKRRRRRKSSREAMRGEMGEETDIYGKKTSGISRF